MENLYKRKYCIGIYENNKDETLIGLFDNPNQLADYLNISLAHARSIVSKRQKGKLNKIVLNGSFFSLELIDMEEDLD